MRAVRMHDVVGPEVLSIDELRTRDPGASEVVMEVHAFALNRADLLMMGNSHYTLANLPCRIGSEAAGVISAVGDGVNQWKVGDRVSTIPHHTETNGVQGDHAIVIADYQKQLRLDAVPDGLLPAG